MSASSERRRSSSAGPSSAPMSVSDDHTPTAAAPDFPELAPGLTLDDVRAEIQTEAQQQLAANAYAQGVAGMLSALATGPTPAATRHDPHEPLTVAALGGQLLAEAHRRAAGSDYVQGANRVVAGALGHPGSSAPHGPASPIDAPPTPSVQELQGFLGRVPGMLAGAADRVPHAHPRDRRAYPVSPGAGPAMPSLAYAPGTGYDAPSAPGSRRSTGPHALDWVVPPPSQHGSAKEDARRSYAQSSAPSVTPPPPPARRGLIPALFAGTGGGVGGDDGRRPRVSRHWSEFKLPKAKGTLAERLLPTLEMAQHEEYKLRKTARMAGMCMNIAIGLQVVFGSLTTGLSAAISSRKGSLITAVFGGILTILATYLARVRGSGEPERSRARAQDFASFIRDMEAAMLDRGWQVSAGSGDGGERDPLDDEVDAFRRRFEELMGNTTNPSERKVAASKNSV